MAEWGLEKGEKGISPEGLSITKGTLGKRRPASMWRSINKKEGKRREKGFRKRKPREKGLKGLDTPNEEALILETRVEKGRENITQNGTKTSGTDALNRWVGIKGRGKSKGEKEGKSMHP